MEDHFSDAATGRPSGLAPGMREQRAPPHCLAPDGVWLCRKLNCLAAIMNIALALLLSGAVSIQAAALKPILSPVQIQKLQELMADHGHDSHVDPAIAKAVGLTKSDKPLVLRQLTMSEDTSDHSQRTYAFQLTTSGGGLLLAVAFLDGVRVYRTNPKQELVAAILEEPHKPLVAIPLAEAQKGLKAELIYWAAIADQS